MTKIKGKLGGFKKSEVDEHIKQIERAQEAEIEELTNKTEACHREKDLLGQELSTLTDQDTDFTSVILLELALNKVERVTSYINQTAEEDVLAIQESSRQKLLALEGAILALDKDIQGAKDKIENELRNIIEVANREELKKSTEFNDKEAIDNVNFGNVYPIADWLKYNKSEQLNKESEFWGEQLERETQPQELVEQMTADGTTKVPLSKPDKLIDTSTKQPDQDGESIVNKSADDLGEESELVQLKVNSETSVAESTSIATECSSPLPLGEVGVSRLDEVDQTDFWDSCPDWEEESDSSLQEIAATEDTEAKPIVSDSTLSEEHDNDDKDDKLEDFFKNEENSEELRSDSVSNGEQSGETRSTEHIQSQAGVRQEIENVRHKYVIGKIAGEDLLDDSGRLIIRKSAKITDSIVEIAQREGKLADLIIHMILPGQEE